MSLYAVVNLALYFCLLRKVDGVFGVVDCGIFQGEVVFSNDKGYPRLARVDAWDELAKLRNVLKDKQVAYLDSATSSYRNNCAIRLEPLGSISPCRCKLSGKETVGPKALWNLTAS